MTTPIFDVPRKITGIGSLDTIPAITRITMPSQLSTEDNYHFDLDLSKTDCLVLVMLRDEINSEMNRRAAGWKCPA